MKNRHLASILVLLGVFAAGLHAQPVESPVYVSYAFDLKPGIRNHFAPQSVGHMVLHGRLAAVGEGYVEVAEANTQALAEYLNSRPHHLTITSGLFEGLSTAVIAVSGGDDSPLRLDLEDSLHNELIGNEYFLIRASHTVADLFGEYNQVGLRKGSSLSEADTIGFFQPNTQSIQSIFYFDSPSQDFAGWLDGSFQFADEKPLLPHEGFIVDRRGSDSPVTAFFHGIAPHETLLGALFAGRNHVSLQNNSVLTLDSLGLETALSAGTSLSDADNVIVYDPETGQASSYFFFVSATFSGWLDASFSIADDVEVLPGALINVRRRTGDDIILFELPSM